MIIKDSYALYTPQIVNWKQNEPNEIKTQTCKCQNIKNSVAYKNRLIYKKGLVKNKFMGYTVFAIFFLTY